MFKGFFCRGKTCVDHVQCIVFAILVLYYLVFLELSAVILNKYTSGLCLSVERLSQKL